MARTTKPLTATEVKNAKAQSKEYHLFDGRGLSLRIIPNNSKYWILNYSRPYTKKRANISLGPYPDVSLAKARTLRENARELLAMNLDPRDERANDSITQQAAMGNTLMYVAEKWFEIKESQLTPGYAMDLWNSLDNHVFPRLGKVPIHKVLAPQLIDVLKPLAKSGRLEMVKRICQRLNQIMIFGVNTGLITANPLAGVSHAFQAPAKKHFPTIKPDELPGFMNTLEKASITMTTLLLIKFQLHSMARPSEAAGTRWEEINFEDKVWTIPPERMKKSRTHIVPLTEQSLEFVEQMKLVSGNYEFVFPAERNPRNSISEQTANMALKRMGYKGKLVAHGMRALASTTLNEEGFDPDLIESALAHVDKNSVRRAYNRADYLERRRVMMSWWSDHIVESTSDDEKSNLIPIRKGVGQRSESSSIRESV